MVLVMVVWLIKTNISKMAGNKIGGFSGQETIRRVWLAVFGEFAEPTKGDHHQSN